MRRWLLTAFALTLALFAALTAFSLAGDVFALFGTRLVKHDLGPLEMRLVTSGDRVVKGLEFYGKSKPFDVVFIGSSRTVFGFDPHSPSLAGLRAYNLGLNGSHSNEDALLLRYAVEHGPKIGRIVFSVDFEEFFREPGMIPEFESSVFGGASPWRGRVMHALSYEALRKTATGLAGAQAFYIDTDGFYHYELQDRRNLLTGDDFWELPSMAAWFPAYMVQPYDGYAAQLETRLNNLVDALRAARAHGVAVDFVLPPVHVSRRAMFDLIGYGARYGEWKRALAKALDKAAAGPGAPLRAFDFSEVGPVATTVFARGAPLERSPYFFEILHFRPYVGDMMIARLLDRPWPAPETPPFGSPLKETTTDARIAADDQAVRAWEKANPALVERIRAIIAVADRR